jgi:hypothetical protein
MRTASAKNAPLAEARHRWRWTPLLGGKAKARGRRRRASTRLPSLKVKARKVMKVKERKPNASRGLATTAVSKVTARQSVGPQNLQHQRHRRTRTRAKEKEKEKAKGKVRKERRIPSRNQTKRNGPPTMIPLAPLHPSSTTMELSPCSTTTVTRQKSHRGIQRHQSPRGVTSIGGTADRP